MGPSWRRSARNLNDRIGIRKLPCRLPASSDQFGLRAVIDQSGLVCPRRLDPAMSGRVALTRPTELRPTRRCAIKTRSGGDLHLGAHRSRHESHMSLNIFVSYSSRDLEHVEAELRETPINVYVADNSMPPGVNISESIEKSISECDQFVLVWSRNARESEWVLQELGQAILLQKPILPIVLDSEMRLPESIAGLKFVSFAHESRQALRLTRDILFGNYEKRQKQLAAIARAQEEKDNVIKLGLTALAFWLFTHK